MTTITQVQVKKDNLSETRVTTHDTGPLGDGDVLTKVDRFSITANNVTYGVVGERIGYWKFFPVADDGWGIIPVWGFADVIESKNPDVPVGDRLYGYWPMADHLVISPTKVKATRLIDGAAHRAELPPVYNSYSRVKAEPHYDPAMENDRAVLMPLYMTSFCLYDFSLDNNWFDAQQVVIPSASSKTAIGTAYAFKTDNASPRLIGLTSSRNKSAVDALNLYDETFVYEDIENIGDKPTLIIDMSGNGSILGRLHKHLGTNMKFTSNVGVTHYDDNKMSADFIRDRSAMFFAPGHIQKRASDWGPGEFEKKAGAFFHGAAMSSRNWLTIKHERGTKAITNAWHDVLEGKTPANESWVVGV